MNYNFNLKCEVCENIVRVKVQGGYEKRNPFNYSCPECGININGILIWNENPEKGFIKEFICNNASESHEFGNESHVLQLATEFYTDKIKKYDENDPTSFLSPFMMDSISFDLKKKKEELIEYITDNFNDNYNTSTRIWQLFKNDNKKYLNRQLLQHKFVEPVPLGQVLKIDYSSKILDVIYRPYSVLLALNEYDKKRKELRKMLNRIKKRNPFELTQLRDDLIHLVNHSDENLMHLLDNFSRYYKYIWPIILSETFKTNNIDEIKESKGILTTSFEDLKNYYVEAFEILCSTLPLLLGIQNIEIRNDRNKFNSKNEKEFNAIDSIVKYDKKVMNKGNKVKFFENENIFSNCINIKSILNNELRNSIGHHSYTVEADKQLITFEDRNKSTRLYLIEFSELLLKTFFATFVSFEVVHFLKNL